MKVRWLITVVGLLAASCVVRVAPATAPPSSSVSCPGAVWVPAHYDATGKLLRPHWRCPSGRIVMVW
jgi:hypothetical protein